MLYLDRKHGEKVRIGDDIVISVEMIRTAGPAEGGKVRLGIDAPKHVQVHRQEVYDAIQRDKKRLPIED